MVGVSLVAAGAALVDGGAARAAEGGPRVVLGRRGRGRSQAPSRLNAHHRLLGARASRAHPCTAAAAGSIGRHGAGAGGRSRCNPPLCVCAACGRAGLQGPGLLQLLLLLRAQLLQLCNAQRAPPPALLPPLLLGGASCCCCCGVLSKGGRACWLQLCQLLLLLLHGRLLLAAQAQAGARRTRSQQQQQGDEQQGQQPACVGEGRQGVHGSISLFALLRWRRHAEAPAAPTVCPAARTTRAAACWPALRC